MIRNVPLLEATMRQILDHPERHHQDWWYAEGACGTVACFAGWACLLSGVELRTDKVPALHPPVSATVNGRKQNVPSAAADLLGLTNGEAWTLFDRRNTSSALQLMVKDLVNGDTLRGPDFYGADRACPVVAGVPTRFAGIVCENLA